MILNDICINITDGKHGDCEPEENSDYYFISSKDIQSGKVQYNDARQITKKDFIESDKRTKLELNDILMTNSGTIGRMCFVDEDAKVGQTTFQKSVALIKPNKDKVDPLFLYYYLNRNIESLIRKASGTSQKNLLLVDLRNFKVKLPERKYQNVIAGKIKAIDDKITINLKIISLLEEYAQLLFYKWFIDFNFPDKNGNPYKDYGGSLHEVDGKIIPVGWEFKCVKDISNKVICGKTPSTEIEDNFGNNIPFITIPDMHGKVFINSTVRSLSKKGAETQKSKYLPIGSICVSCIASPGIVVMTTEISQTNQQINSVIPINTNFQYFLYLYLKRFGKNIGKISGGSIAKNMNTTQFSNIKVLTPTNDLLKVFQELISPIFEGIKMYDRQIEVLTEARDLLIKKLIS